MWVNLFAYQTNDDIENTTLIVGSTRSGTTYLMESINAENEYRVIFEPFNSTYTTEWKRFGSRHYIDPDQPTTEEKIAVDTILKGRLNNNWVDQYNRKIKADKRIIKSVRGNLLIDYIANKYPELRIIYLFRNPYKVIASRLKLNFDRRDVYSILEHTSFLKKYYSDVDLVLLKRHLNSAESCHTALWCFENRFLLQEQGHRRMEYIQYEKSMEASVNHRPSATTSTLSSYQLSTEERDHINNVIGLFGMEELVKELWA